MDFHNLWFLHGWNPNIYSNDQNGNMLDPEPAPLSCLKQTCDEVMSVLSEPHTCMS